jgi:transcriptional regulator with XRE-family HTH domain
MRSTREKGAMTFRAYRKKQKMTQKDAAGKMRLCLATVQRIEYGQSVSRRTALIVQEWTKGKVAAAGLMGV